MLLLTQKETSGRSLLSRSILKLDIAVILFSYPHLLASSFLSSCRPVLSILGHFMSVDWRQNQGLNEAGQIAAQKRPDRIRTIIPR